MLRRAAGPLDRFLHIEAASGVVLLVAAALALLAANSGWAESYRALWHAPIGIRLGSFAFERSLEWCVNDGLMVIFFFVVGLEIRRELHRGELSEWRRAALPVLAALGGVVVPALFYVMIASAPATRDGWAVPTATDIAFAVGVLALLGKRVPPALRVLLLALAVIDDLAAIVVIAAFYSSGIEWIGLLIAAAGVALVFAFRAAGIRAKSAYVLPGLVVWAGTYGAGIHPTIAGVVLGLVTPVRAWLGMDGFLRLAPQQFEELTRVVDERPNDAHALSLALAPLTHARREALSPAEYLIELLHPWVAFAIMPLFALANAGVSLEGMSLEGTSGTVALAVGIGLVAGKPLGILLFTAVAIRSGVARLPAGISGAHLLVLGMVAGIGFTMALFIAQLAFADPELLGAAKLGVLAASGIAGVLGLSVGRALLSAAPTAERIAESADEAECSTEV
jgi:NhaA family Na+:H+ antiporter